jgi:hypothetical protein
MDLQILARTGAKATVTFYSDGVAADSSTQVKVDVVRPDGTLLITQANATDEAGTGVYGYQLAPQADPTLLRLDWSGTVGGTALTVSTWVEVVGRLLFNLADLRDLKVGNGRPFENPQAWPPERLMEARTATLDEFQRILWFSPVPRHARAALSGDGSAALQLPHYEVRTVLAATVDGTALTSEEVADLYLDGRFVVRKTLGVWPTGVGNVTVEYSHGLPGPPGDGGNIGVLRAAMRLNPSAMAEATSVVTPDGTSYNFGDPAGQVTRAGQVRHFGIPAIDSWLNRWKVA